MRTPRPTFEEVSLSRTALSYLITYVVPPRKIVIIPYQKMRGAFDLSLLRMNHVASMQLRQTKTNFSITGQSRKLYRRCVGGGIRLALHLQPVRKTIPMGKRIPIRWDRPKNWCVPIHAASQFETAEI